MSNPHAVWEAINDLREMAADEANLLSESERALLYTVACWIGRYVPPPEVIDGVAAFLAKPPLQTRTPPLCYGTRSPHPPQHRSRPMDNRCTLPPEGWLCTREAGHEGPCAAVSEISAWGERLRSAPDRQRLMQLIEWATALIDHSSVATAYTAARTAEMRTLATSLLEDDHDPT